MTVQVGDLTSFANSTYNRIAKERGLWQDIAHTSQNFHVMSRLLKEKSVTYKSGKAIEWYLTEIYNESPKAVGLMEPDTLNMARGSTRAEIPWMHMTGNLTVEEHLTQMNSESPERVYDEMLMNRHHLLGGWAEYLETVFCQDTPNDSKTPFSLLYWVVKYNNSGVFGFDGGNPTNFSSGAGGLTVAAHPNTKNAAYAYSAVTDDDLISGLEQMFDKTVFKSPARYDSLVDEKTRRELLTNYAALQAYRSFLKTMGDGSRRDAGDVDEVVFRKIPLVWMSELDADTTNPYYMVDWSSLQFAVLKNFFLKEGAFKEVSGYHNVRAMFMDLSLNLMCYDRRRNGVAYNPA